MRGRQHAYALVRDWLGARPAVERGAALAELARRYLAGHGPADDRDLARWAGLSLRDARAGLAAISRSVVHREDALVDLARRAPAAGLPPPRLLGAFEPFLLGWRSRADVLGAHERAVVSGGLFRPVALARGRAVATWRLRDAEVGLEPFAPLSRTVGRALDADAVEVVRFLADRA
jgi:hypothetical protein